MLTESEFRVLTWLSVTALVTVWSRRFYRTRYRHVGYVHDSTVRAMQWQGVPVHHHKDDEKALNREPHTALYEIKNATGAVPSIAPHVDTRGQETGEAEASGFTASPALR